MKNWVSEDKTGSGVYDLSGNENNFRILPKKFYLSSKLEFCKNTILLIQLWRVVVDVT